MKKTFAKKDLLTGDIIVNARGDLGVVILEEDIILYQNGGYDFLFSFSDDLRDAVDQDRSFDIREVYRNPGHGPIGFLDYEECEMVFERDEKEESRPEETAAPSKNHPDDRSAEKEQKDLPKEDQRSELIGIISQAFYGNRTYTEISRDDVDTFLAGILDPKLIKYEKYDITKGRTIIPIPGSEELVLVYNQTAEEEALNASYPKKALAEIPEIGLKIYSRCFVCRISREGALESLKPGDSRQFIEYLAR